MYTCSGTSLFITWMGAQLQFRASSRHLLLASPFLLALLSTGMRAQTSATFGDVIQLGGTPSDIVLDESRHRLYLVNTPASRVDVYDYSGKTLLGSIGVGTAPLGAGISMDNAFLYVANHDSSSLSVITLDSAVANSAVNTISLPAKPQSVEVGADGRALISTDGSGTAGGRIRC